jgi:hypothetical protein
MAEYKFEKEFNKVFLAIGSLAVSVLEHVPPVLDPTIFHPAWENICGDVIVMAISESQSPPQRHTTASDRYPELGDSP